MAKFAPLAFDELAAPPLARDKSKTAAQAKLMRAIAHGWKPSGMKNPPPKDVAEEFNDADKGSSVLKKKVR